MIKTISEYDFTQAFAQSERKEQFSYGALKAIFAYYEEYEEGTGESIEMDIIAICCEFTEYESAYAAFTQYGDNTDLDIDWLDGEQAENEKRTERLAREWLEERTTVLDATNYNSDLKEVSSIVIVNF